MTPLAWLFIFILIGVGTALIYLALKIIATNDTPKHKVIFEKRASNWNNLASPHFVVQVIEKGFGFQTVMFMALTADSPPLPYPVIEKNWSDKHYAIAQASEWVASAQMNQDWIKSKVYADPNLEKFVDGAFELNVFAKKVLDHG